MRCTNKGRSVFAGRQFKAGEFICKYEGELCSYSVFRDRIPVYNNLGFGSYILEFKFKEKRWAIDATKEDGTLGRLINHSRLLNNIKPVVGVKDEIPYVYFVAIRTILKGEELLYDYSDKSKTSKIAFPWLGE